MFDKSKKNDKKNLLEETLSLKQITFSFESLYYFSRKEIRNIDLIRNVSKILKVLRTHNESFQEVKRKFAKDLGIIMLGNQFSADIKDSEKIIKFQESVYKLEKQTETITFKSKIKFSTIKKILDENPDLKLNMNFLEHLDWLIDYEK